MGSFKLVITFCESIKLDFCLYLQETQSGIVWKALRLEK